jgi:hypothetical protein
VLIIDVFMLIYLLRVDMFGDFVVGGGSMSIRNCEYKQSCAPDITMDGMKAAPDSGRNPEEVIW